MRPVSWERCPCGKVLCDSDTDALRKARVQHFLHGATHPVAVYECPDNPGAWHWTRNNAHCPCGRLSSSQSKISRTVDRINRVVHGGIHARPYQCPHGGHHWVWYPVGRKFRFCAPCSLPAYPDPMAAQEVADFREREHGKGHRVYRCEASRWHIKTGADPCTEAGAHQGKQMVVVVEDVQQVWWTCCGEVSLADPARI